MSAKLYAAAGAAALVTCAIPVAIAVAIALVPAGSPAAEPRAAATAKRPPLETPWLTREAADQVVAADGRPGPLFSEVELGGPPPPPSVRAQIAEFARANRIDIDFEVVDRALVAVRFGVTFGGCCGYEGADNLAQRLGRPKTPGCRCDFDWADDWSTQVGNTHIAGRVRVNRVDVRWEPALTLPQVYERAMHLIGRDTTTLGAAAGDRWIVLDPDRYYLLEVPHVFPGYIGYDEDLWYRDDLGFRILASHGRVVEVAFTVPGDPEIDTFVGLGKPTFIDGERVWDLADRSLRTRPDGEKLRVTLRKHGSHVVAPSHPSRQHWGCCVC